MDLFERNIGHALKIETFLAERHLMHTIVNNTVLFAYSCKQLSFNVS